MLTRVATRNGSKALSKVRKGRKFLRRAWMFRRTHRGLGEILGVPFRGAALSTDTEDFFRRMGYAVVQGYGMTESASADQPQSPVSLNGGLGWKNSSRREFRLAEDGEILCSRRKMLPRLLGKR